MNYYLVNIFSKDNHYSFFMTGKTQNNAFANMLYKYCSPCYTKDAFLQIFENYRIYTRKEYNDELQKMKNITNNLQSGSTTKSDNERVIRNKEKYIQQEGDIIVEYEYQVPYVFKTYKSAFKMIVSDISKKVKIQIENVSKDTDKYNRLRNL